MSAIPDPACTSLRWALALLDGLVAGGVEQLVLSPGSRSTPLVLAAQRQPALTLTPILDERSAAFFALGLTRASRRPVALLCTSGSAPGNWLPAVIEAHASGLPLILLSADRPPQLRAWGANQTVDQTRLFGAFVLEFHDPGMPQHGPAALKAMRALGTRAAAMSRGRRGGPVHLNLPFPEPLVPAADCRAEAVPASSGRTIAPTRGPTPAWSAAESPPALPPGRGILVCGPGDFTDAAEGLWRCAAHLGLPVLVDPLSGLRFGPAGRGRIARYDGLLRNPQAARALRPDWVLRLGAAPVSKALGDWLRGIPTVLVDPGGQWRDPSHDAVLQVDARAAVFLDLLAASNAPAADPDWVELWIGAEERLATLAGDYLGQAPWCEPQVIAALIDRLPPGSALFSGNSLPIRQLDTWSGTRGAALAVHGNRGASGIDGNVSTLAGLNAAGLPTLGVMGDLTLLHDLSGLLLADRLRLPLIVINNGGGRIFDYLPQRGLRGFADLWRTPVALDMRRLAGLFDLPFRPVGDAGAFARALEEALGAPGPGLIEVRIDAEVSLCVHREFWQRVGQESLVPPGAQPGGRTFSET